MSEAAHAAAEPEATGVDGTPRLTRGTAPARLGRVLLRRWTGWLLVGVVAVALRGAYWYQVAPAPYFDALTGDARAYDAWAQRIAAGDWIGSEAFYQAPLYPYFLAVIYSVAGHELAVVRLVQVALGCAACVMVFEAARRWFGPATGLVAGVMLAAYPPSLFFDLQIDKTVLDEALLAGVLVVLATMSTRRPSNWLCAACGVLLGFLCLTRENALLLVAIVAAWLALHGRRAAPPVPIAPRLCRAALLLAGVALVLIPVLARNLWVGGDAHLTTSQFGPNFYIGNNAAADGTYRPLRPGRGDALYERLDATELAEAAQGRRLSPGEVSSYWTRRAVDDIAAAPLRWLGLLGRKGLMVWSAAEIADTGDFDTHVAWSPVLRGLSLAWHFGVLAPLAAAGAVLTWRDRRRHGILYALILGYAAATAVFYLFARYRYPLVPMLVPLAAAGVVTAINPIGRREWRRLIVAGCVATVVAIVSNAAWVLPPRLRGADHYNRALAHVRRNEPERAAEAYRRALRVNPRLVDARNNLGLLLAGRGQIDAAIEQYAAALALRDDDPAVHNNIGMALAQAGRRGEAIDHFQRAVRLQPDLTPAWFNLGVALAMEGRPDDAAAALETVLRRDPSHSGASQWLARVRPSPATLPTTAP